jgi:hypothetical protein
MPKIETEVLLDRTPTVVRLTFEEFVGKSVDTAQAPKYVIATDENVSILDGSKGGYIVSSNCKTVEEAVKLIQERGADTERIKSLAAIHSSKYKATILLSGEKTGIDVYELKQRDGVYVANTQKHRLSSDESIIAYLDFQHRLAIGYAFDEHDYAPVTPDKVRVEFPNLFDKSSSQIPSAIFISVENSIYPMIRVEPTINQEQSTLEVVLEHHRTLMLGLLLEDQIEQIISQALGEKYADITIKVRFVR